MIIVPSEILQPNVVRIDRVHNCLGRFQTHKSALLDRTKRFKNFKRRITRILNPKFFFSTNFLKAYGVEKYYICSKTSYL